MSKKASKTPAQEIRQEYMPDLEVGTNDSKIIQWLCNFRIQAILVAVLAFVSYINTSKNEYALDDLIVIVSNEYVYEGFAGLPDIFSKDAFESYCRVQSNSSNQLAGGRYRPLSIATFAIEQQFLGAVPKTDIDSVLVHAREAGPQENKLLSNMHVRHVFNVLWYMLAVLALLYLLRFVVFRRDPIVALIATILFTVHPVHTEVVANVKSRDEIMSLLFICLTFIFAFQYREHKKIWQLGLGITSYALALLSKEYGVAMILLLPLAFYMFGNESFKKSIRLTVPYFVVMVLYFITRLQIIGFDDGSANNNDIWNNPYAFATGAQKVATEIATTLNYLKLLLFPVPLSSDYSYNTIAYKSFAHPLVWLSLIVHLALIAGFFYFLKRRNVLAFAIAFYMLHLLLVCNVIYDIGGTMGERLIFHSSVGFAIATAYLLCKGRELIKSQSRGNIFVAGIMVVVIVFSEIRVIARNADWKNDVTLMSQDIKVVPNSLLVNTNLGVAILSRVDEQKDEKEKNKMLYQGIALLNRSIVIDSNSIPAYLNKGLAFFRLKQADSARVSYDKVIKFMPGYARMPELYYNVGVLYYFNKQFPQAISVWQTVLKLQPNYAVARQNIAIAMHDMSLQSAASGSK